VRAQVISARLGERGDLLRLGIFLFSNQFRDRGGPFLMKRAMPFALLFVFTLAVFAQEMSNTGVVPPPKVMAINREFLKPGRGGSTHDRSESAFVQAFARAKYPTHYLALDSLSGRSRSLFITGYDSFDAMEKDYFAMQKNPALGAALERAAAADGDLLSDYDQSILIYNEAYSLRAPLVISQMRLFEISVFRVRSGHRKDWDALVKLVSAAYEKIPDIHWATYELAYGQMDRPTYVVFSPLRSAADIDHEFALDKDFAAALGADGMKKLGELEEAAVESSQSNLFAINPRMSYVPDAWIKADPQFWKPAAPPMPKKPVEKPEEKPPAQQ
jgi:hypothetical protein